MSDKPAPVQGEEQQQNVYEALLQSLNKVTRDQLYYGNWIQGESAVITSTTTNQPSKPLTIADLNSAIEMVKKGDALQQKGIGKDWFCVINPQLVEPIKEMAKQYVKVPNYVMSPFEIDYIMGRRVLIDVAAPLNIEYMDQQTAKRKYPSHFESTNDEVK